MRLIVASLLSSFVRTCIAFRRPSPFSSHLRISPGSLIFHSFLFYFSGRHCLLLLFLLVPFHRNWLLLMNTGTWAWTSAEAATPPGAPHIKGSSFFRSRFVVVFPCPFPLDSQLSVIIDPYLLSIDFIQLPQIPKSIPKNERDARGCALAGSHFDRQSPAQVFLVSTFQLTKQALASLTEYHTSNSFTEDFAAGMTNLIPT